MARIPMKKTTNKQAAPADADTKSAEATGDEVERALAAIDSAATDAGTIAPKIRAATARLRAARGFIVAAARAHSTRVQRHNAGPSGKAATQGTVSLIREAVARTGGDGDADAVLARVPGEMQRLASNMLRSQLLDDKATNRAEQIAAQLVESIRAVKIAIESERDRFLGPPSMDTTRAREVENNYDREQDVREMGIAAAFGQWQRYIDRGEEENARKWGAALYSVARAIVNGPASEAVRGRGPARSGEIDKQRAAAFEVISALKRHRATQAPASLGVAVTLYEQLVSAFRLLVGEHACWMSAAHFSATMGVTSNDELAIDKQWATRWLRPEQRARGVRAPFAPSWNPLAPTGDT